MREALQQQIEQILTEEIAAYEKYPWKAEGAIRVAKRIVEAVEEKPAAKGAAQ